MKTKRIALAVLAAACCGAFPAAYADDGSSVIIYGYVRAGVDAMNGNANAVWGESASNARSSTVNVAGRGEVNFRGVENLGNGLAAVFQVQNEFSPTNATGYDDQHGTHSAGFASDDSYVGLKGGFGQLRLGKGTGNFEDGKYENTVIVGPDQMLGWFGDALGNNMVRYDLPSFGAFNASIQYSTEENKSASYNGTQHVSLGASYDVGRWGVSGAFASTGNAMVTDGSQVAVSATNQTTAFGWATNQGATGTLNQAHLTAMYKPTDSLQLVVELQRNTLAGDAQNKGALYGYYTMGSVQFGLQGGVQSYSGHKPSGLSNEKFVDGFVHYSLSKQTMVYLEALQDKDGASGAGSRTFTVLGMVKNF
ncbi:porin [Paludibacterium yongneupense]|uniref:porin n=1 Tax=Paludibacterium yongneupense TaxID=400061 RepID=UPI00048DD3D2|nr:porin [Paludibacterium yongneupense]